MTNQRNRRSRNNRTQPVRIVDDYAGNDGLKMDRVLSQLQNSHSQVRILANDSFTLSTTAAVGGTTGIIAGSQVRIFDEFVSMASQFETFRISMIRYDIYDINPGQATANAFGTFHDVYTTANQPTFALATVLDSPDSQAVPPGTGKVSLIWKAKGTLENTFQSTNLTAVPAEDFGGLRFALPQATAAAQKYLVMVKAVVDFRARA